MNKTYYQIEGKTNTGWHSASAPAGQRFDILERAKDELKLKKLDAIIDGYEDLRIVKVEETRTPLVEPLREHIMSPMTDKTLTELLAHERILELEKQIKVYDHMREVAKANGFSSLGGVMVGLDKYIKALDEIASNDPEANRLKADAIAITALYS